MTLSTNYWTATNCVIGIDTNILIYGDRRETHFHFQARKLIDNLYTGTRSWALPWPCVYEYLRVVTHPRAFDPPTLLETAVANIERLMQSPSVTMLRESPSHFQTLSRTLLQAHATGNLVFDARIAALCLEHGVTEFYTMDRDFSRFPGLKVVCPF